MCVPEPTRILWRMSRGRFGRWFNWLFDVAPDDQARECMYRDCALVVRPHEGFRQSGMVFCSEDHAAEDQTDRAF